MSVKFRSSYRSSISLQVYVDVLVSQDATCFIWNYEGQVVQKFKGHKVSLYLAMA